MIKVMHKLKNKALYIFPMLLLITLFINFFFINNLKKEKEYQKSLIESLKKENSKLNEQLKLQKEDMEYLKNQNKLKEKMIEKQGKRKKAPAVRKEKDQRV